jgi:hypothetical protein
MLKFMLQHACCSFTNLVFVVDCNFGMWCIKKDCLLFIAKSGRFSETVVAVAAQSSLKTFIVSAS